MNLILKYKNHNNNIISGNCAQILRISNQVRRFLDGTVDIINDECKYESTICGVGAMPNLEMNKEMELECSEQITQIASEDGSFNIKYKIADNSLFGITQENEIVALKSIENLYADEKKYLKIIYRPVINVYAIKLTSEINNMDSMWKLELIEA